MYLAFNWFTLQIPFFYGWVAFCRSWLEGTCYLLSKDSVPLFPQSGLETDLFIRRFLSPNWKALSLFPLTKRVLLLALRLRPIIWLLHPPPPHPVMLLNDLHSFSVHRSWSAGSPYLFILTWIRYFIQQAGCEELTFIHIPLLTVNLWGQLVLTQKGRGNWSYFSSLSGIPRHTCFLLTLKFHTLNKDKR